ncbi:MAG TPA: TonB-dependent receptor [Puia sp.]|nr:TonB-dependent receptor [Puia sp.]
MISCIFHGLGQERPGAIQGKIQDSALDRGCAFVVVAILDQDSSLVRFTRTKRDGSWVIRGLPTGGYLLLTSHPSYDAYLARVVIKCDSITDLGTLYLEPKSDTLAAAIVTPKNPPMHIRGDTLEYNTSNVKMKVNATVEKMLKRLPGVTVNQDGTISINGVRVERLLVDGEDFFGGDPKIATQNLNADMIAKIQFIDKKSSQAEFTGVDDGQRTKTVNLVLKEDAKKGYFVRGEAGDGPQGFYNVNGMLGAFRGPRQLAVLAMTANNGNTGFSGEGAGLSIGGAGDALGASAGGGIPQVEGAGAHYADKWNANRNHVSGNGSFGFMSIRPYSSTITQQTLPDSVYTQAQQSSSVNTSNQQRLNADYDYIPDTVQAFRFSLGGMKAAGQDQYVFSGSSAFNDTLVNSSKTNIHGIVDNQNFNGNIMWRVRSRKTRARNFAVTAGMSEQSNTTTGYLYVLNNFYKPDGSLLNIDTTDQRKAITSLNKNFNGSLNYTEPLWKNTVLALRYNLNVNRSESRQATFDRGDGKYSDFVDSLSNHYQNNVISQSATLNIQGSGKPLTYTIGGEVIQFSNAQKDLQKDSTLKYHYLTLNPRINARFAISKNQGISLNYSANTEQPSINQLQPVQNNNNPLYITLGNPNLRSGFSQNFGFGFDAVKPIYFNMGLNFGYMSNAISTKVTTDRLGRQISQAVNVSGSRNVGVYFGFNHKFMPVGIEIGMNFNGNAGRSVNYVGDILSNNDIYNAGGGMSIGKYVADRFNIRLGANANYSATRSSINTSQAIHFWTQNENFELSWFILPGLELNTNGYYNWQQKTSAFVGNTSTFFWNAFVSKNFLQNRLVVKWWINDILGQNAGIGRSISGNTTSQTSSNVVGRYWMISASYRFIRHGRIK